MVKTFSPSNLLCDRESSDSRDARRRRPKDPHAKRITAHEKEFRFKATGSDGPREESQGKETLSYEMD